MADRILNRVPVDKLEEIRDLLTEKRHGNPARSPAHNARLLVDELLAVAPPPRLVPDRPSDYVLVPREPTEEMIDAAYVYDSGTPTAEERDNLKTDYRLMIAAAPPAEAPGEHVKVLQAILAENEATQASFPDGDWWKAECDALRAAIQALAAAPAAPANVPSNMSDDHCDAAGDDADCDHSCGTVVVCATCGEPAAPAEGGEAMALHWIDRYAAGIDDEPQMDRIRDALAPRVTGGREVESADDLIRALGWEPERFRTDGGHINSHRLRAAIRHPDEYSGLALQAATGGEGES